MKPTISRSPETLQWSTSAIVSIQHIADDLARLPMLRLAVLIWILSTAPKVCSLAIAVCMPGVLRGHCYATVCNRTQEPRNST